MHGDTRPVESDRGDKKSKNATCTCFLRRLINTATQLDYTARPTSTLNFGSHKFSNKNTAALESYSILVTV